jgi:hypothetical protein
MNEITLSGRKVSMEFDSIEKAIQFVIVWNELRRNPKIHECHLHLYTSQSSIRPRQRCKIPI